MAKNIKVTIIVPFYKVEDYFKKCLDSIVNQTMQELEIILIDDCGGDSSIEIAREYAQKDSRIIVVQNEKNSGQGYSRNIGIRMAKGEYVAFVDADDWLEPKMYEELYEKAKRTGADITKCSFKSVYSDRIESYAMASYCNDFDKTYSVFDNPTKLLGEIIAVVWNAVYKKDFLLKNNLFFDEIVKYEDEHYCWLSMVTAQKIAFIEDVFYNYNKMNDRADTQQFKYIKKYSLYNLTDLIKPLILHDKRLHNAFIIHSYRLCQWILTFKVANKKKVFKDFSKSIEGLCLDNLKEIFKLHYDKQRIMDFIAGDYKKPKTKLSRLLLGLKIFRYNI